MPAGSIQRTSIKTLSDLHAGHSQKQVGSGEKTLKNSFVRTKNHNNLTLETLFNNHNTIK